MQMATATEVEEASLTHSPASLLQSRTTSKSSSQPNPIGDGSGSEPATSEVRQCAASPSPGNGRCSLTDRGVGRLGGAHGRQAGRFASPGCPPPAAGRFGLGRSCVGVGQGRLARRPSASCGRAGPCYRDGRERLRRQKTAIAVDSFAYPTSTAPPRASPCVAA
jgi:hypothetical protein